MAGLAADTGAPPKYSNHSSAAAAESLFNGEK